MKECCDTCAYTDTCSMGISFYIKGGDHTWWCPDWLQYDDIAVAESREYKD